MVGPATALAGALPGDDGDVTIIVDGNIHNASSEQVASPVPLPGPIQAFGEGAEVEVRTYDLVLPNPVGGAYRLADARLPGPPIGAVAMDGHAVAFQLPQRQVVIPWYYMMDDAAIRPYHVLFWDTSTAWYLDYGADLFGEYAHWAAPGKDPFAVAKTAVPNVHVQTAVEEIELAAELTLLLQGALEPAADSGVFARPDAPSIQGTFRPADAALLAPEPVAPASDAGRSGAPAAWEPQLRRTGAAVGPLGLVAPSALAMDAVQAAAVGVTVVAGVALYHLIRKSAILKNRVRSTIAEHVLRQPGSTITEIAQAVGVTHQTASYHLRLLQEHGLVLGVEKGNKRLYFRNDGSFNGEERKLVAVLRDAESMRVLDLIRQNPWIMKNEAAAALGVSRNTLNWHLQKLISAGLVSEARENGYCFLFCNRKASDELLAVVQHKVDERRDGTAPNGSGAPAPPAAANAAPGPVFGNGHGAKPEHAGGL